jgi:hypothetical protein
MAKWILQQLVRQIQWSVLGSYGFANANAPLSAPLMHLTGWGPARAPRSSCRDRVTTG